MSKWLLVLAAIVCGLAVGLGAFGAHGLKKHLNETYEVEVAKKKLDQWETAAHYQMTHGLAVLGLSILAITIRLNQSLPEETKHRIDRNLVICCCLFLFGVTVFSGCLYLMVVTDIRMLGAIVPIGGVAMISGWAGLAWTGIIVSKKIY